MMDCFGTKKKDFSCLMFDQSSKIPGLDERCEFRQGNMVYNRPLLEKDFCEQRKTELVLEKLEYTLVNKPDMLAKEMVYCTYIRDHNGCRKKIIDAKTNYDNQIRQAQNGDLKDLQADFRSLTDARESMFAMASKLKQIEKFKQQGLDELVESNEANAKYDFDSFNRFKRWVRKNPKQWEKLKMQPRVK